MVRAAEQGGIDLIGIQDHPYQHRFLDTWLLIADLLARTERLRFFPDVANLPLRMPTLMAKQAASLDWMSGGRFELGLGAGAFWEGIEAMGGRALSPGESVDALEEAIPILRACWSGERAVSFEGEHYRVKGFHPGPPPAHPIEIWIGAYKPRMLRLTGRLADGWLPSQGYMPPEQVAEARKGDRRGGRRGGARPVRGPRALQRGRDRGRRRGLGRDADPLGRRAERDHVHPAGGERGPGGVARLRGGAGPKAL